MDFQQYTSHSDNNRWSSLTRPSFGGPPKKWKSSRREGENRSAHLLATNYPNESKIGRTTSPIVIKLIPYSTTTKFVETDANSENSSLRPSTQNGIGAARSLNLAREERRTSDSPPLKVSCALGAWPSSISNNSINNEASSYSRNRYRRNCYDRTEKTSFVVVDVQKPTSFGATNCAKLRAAKSESSLRAMSQPSTTLLNDRDQDQVEMMYSSQGAKVFVCSCLANLYFDQSYSAARNGNVQWELIVTGIPVVLMNCGESRSRANKQLQIILAERGTGFTLWKEVITDFSRYEEQERTFHTLNTSSEPKRLAGLSFDDAFSAVKFFQHLKAAQKDHSDSNSSRSKLSSGVKQRRHSFVLGGNGCAKKLSLRKAEISTPVCFKHITSVKPADVNPVIMCAGNALVQKRAQSCVQILSIGDNTTKSIQ